MQYEVFVLASISCKEGVACGVQFCMKSLFWRQSVVRRVCLAFNTRVCLYRNTVQYASISCKEGVACGVQFCMKSLFWRQYSCKEGVSSIQYFIAIQCYMKSLFWRQSVVRRVWLVVYSSV